MIKKILLYTFFAGYLFTLLTTIVSPQSLGIFVLLAGGILPYTFAIILVTSVLVIRREKSVVRWIALALLLLAIFQLGKVFQISGNDDWGRIKVMSFNASFFRVPGVYSPEYLEPVLPSINGKIRDWILAQQADIICIQEFFDDELSAEFNNLKRFTQDAGYDHYYLNNPWHDNGVSRGIAIFSRYPIVQEQKIFLSDNRYNGSIYADIAIGSDTIRVVNTHLKSSMLGFKKAELKSVQGVKNYLSTMRHDARIKGEQVDMIIEVLEHTPYPVIICGDFNSTRYTYVFRQLKSNYRNAFADAGSGLGFTFNGRIPLPIKIDHQFYGEGLEVKSCEVKTDQQHSDHLPLFATYDLVRK